MKKLIFPASVIVLVAMVPAILFGYLHTSADENKAGVETVSETHVSQDNSTIISLVKSF